MTTLEQAAREHIKKTYGDFLTDEQFDNLIETDLFKAGAHWERKRILELLRSVPSDYLDLDASWLKEWADWLEKRLGDEK